MQRVMGAVSWRGPDVRGALTSVRRTSRPWTRRESRGPAMPEEKLETIRQPIVLDAHSRRRIEERLALRFPSLTVSFTRRVQRLPLRSRLRQAVVRRAAKLVMEALNRKDFEAAFALYDENVQLATASELVRLGFDGTYQGREERVRFQRRWISEWGDFQFAPEELFTLDDHRVFVSGRIVGSGRRSGASVDNYWGAVLTISEGRVVREEFFWDRDEALEAAGLSE